MSQPECLWVARCILYGDWYDNSPLGLYSSRDEAKAAVDADALPRDGQWQDSDDLSVLWITSLVKYEVEPVDDAEERASIQRELSGELDWPPYAGRSTRQQP